MRGFAGFLRVVTRQAAQRIFHARMQNALACSGLSKPKRIIFNKQRAHARVAQGIQCKKSGASAANNQRINNEWLIHVAIR